MEYTYEEAIELLELFVDNPSGLKISDLDDLISLVSTVDTTVSEDAVTHLYTRMGEDTSFIGDNVRLLDHTDAAKVLLYKHDGAKTSLMDLQVINVSSTDSGTHGFCVKDSENNITVIYSGDYAYSDSWVDNFVGAVKEDSNEQENALIFFEDCMKKAEEYGDVGNVTVSGHSKGGNLAQYVTILSEDVDYCLSYDGQGFSDQFISYYADKIAANGSKITSISANYDFVHCALNPIPNAQHYFVDVEMKPDELSLRTLAWFHMPILILDENGNILPFVEESEFSKALHVISNTIVDIGDNDLDNMKSVLEDIGTVVDKVLSGKSVDEILPYILNVEMVKFALQILPAIAADTCISGGIALDELVSDEGLRFVLEHTSEEALEYFLGENIADASSQSFAPDLASLLLEFPQSCTR